jgi:membrane fusion protein (multidrug efflux system)
LSDAEFEQLKAARGATGVRLKLPDGKPYARPGRLNFTASTVDTRLGTVQMRAEFANPAMDILPGQFVRVELSIGTREAFLLPQTAVLQGDRGRFVWTVGEDGKAAARPVQVGNWIGNDWVILSGLKPGDKVVLDNLLRVRPGTQIQPPAAPASAAAPAVTPAPADSNKK